MAALCGGLAVIAGIEVDDGSMISLCSWKSDMSGSRAAVRLKSVSWTSSLCF